jgi:hypothetical protein
MGYMKEVWFKSSAAKDYFNRHFSVTRAVDDVVGYDTFHLLMGVWMENLGYCESAREDLLKHMTSLGVCFEQRRNVYVGLRRKQMVSPHPSEREVSYLRAPPASVPTPMKLRSGRLVSSM